MRSKATKRRLRFANKQLSGTVAGGRLVGEWTLTTTTRGTFSELTWNLGAKGLPESLLVDLDAFTAAARRATTRPHPKRATSRRAVQRR